MFYIFLDFDGVLHPCLRSKGALFSCLPRFADFLRRNPSIQVVISSSWRKTDDFKKVRPHAQLRKYFPEDLRARIVGCTPALPRTSLDEPEYQRELEVKAWLDTKKKQHVPYAILDDAHDMFSPNMPQLILCNEDIGFDAEVESTLQTFVDEALGNVAAHGPTGL